MTAITESKTPSQNRLEGFALTALFQGLPTYANALLAIKVMGAREIVGSPDGPVIFVVLASLFHGILVPWLAPKFPKRFGQGHEPLFFDCSLSFSEKIAQWRVQPLASLQLVTTVVMMSVLAVGAVSIR
jgi:hypothetical protein